MNDDEAMLVETVRQFVDKEVKPTVREREHANEYPEAWIEQMKRIGIYGLAIGEEYGGAPVSMPCYVLVTQELARGWMSLAGAMGGHTVVAKLLTLFGTEEQKQQYLPPMASGELRATMALTEPGGGSDLQNMSTTAVRDGDDLVINGSKTWISNARRSGLLKFVRTASRRLIEWRRTSQRRTDNLAGLDWRSPTFLRTTCRRKKRSSRRFRPPWSTPWGSTRTT